MYTRINVEDIKIGDKIRIEGTSILEEGEVTRITPCLEKEQCPLPLAGGCIGVSISVDKRHAWCAKIRRCYFIEQNNKVNKVMEI